MVAARDVSKFVAWTPSSRSVSVASISKGPPRNWYDEAPTSRRKGLTSPSMARAAAGIPLTRFDPPNRADDAAAMARRLIGGALGTCQMRPQSPG